MMVLLILVCTIVPLIYYYLMKERNYWRKQGVPFVEPVPIFGNLMPMIMLQKSPGEMMADLYNRPEGKNQRFLGMFIWNNEPALLLRDPELIKHILVKDFAHFNNRNVECDPVKDPVGFNNLFTVRDKKWRYLRAKLAPTFTSGKLKLMFHLIHGVGNEMLKNINDSLKENQDIIDTKELAAKYTTDVISTCAFGVQSNTLNDPNAIFRQFGRMIFETSARRALETRSFFFMHWWSRFSGAIFLHKEAGQFFRDVFWDVFEAREKAGAKRNDFIDTLIQLKQEAAQKLETAEEDEKDIFEFTGDSLVAQSVLFFTAGFETTSLTLTYTLTELACHPEYQEILRKEIMGNVKSHDNQLTYDGLFEMKYMEKVVSEILRKYPAMPFIDRRCSQDYKIPDSDVVINTPLFLSTYEGLHYDPEYFPDPLVFDPERFSPEAKATRHPFAYLPFGEGPHICIGMRFALMNIKTALSLILLNYRVEATEGISMPIKMAPRPILTTAEGKLPLKFVPLLGDGTKT